jgi:hypothetical protein
MTRTEGLAARAGVAARAARLASRLRRVMGIWHQIWKREWAISFDHILRHSDLKSCTKLQG